MTHFWVEEAAGQGWSICPLSGDDGGPSGGPLARWLGAGTNPARPPALLLRRGSGPAEEWVLLASQSCIARVNGLPLLLGARVLRDRDEVVLRAGDRALRCFFSTERLPCPEVFPSDSGVVRCARCKDVISPGVPAVRCPACDLWHHQIQGGRECWTYSPGCASCGHPTELGGQYRWTPEGL
jgi:hypothetical protein